MQRTKLNRGFALCFGASLGTAAAVLLAYPSWGDWPPWLLALLRSSLTGITLTAIGWLWTAPGKIR